MLSYHEVLPQFLLIIDHQETVVVAPLEMILLFYLIISGSIFLSMFRGGFTFENMALLS
jgi:hypothetical protein